MGPNQTTVFPPFVDLRHPRPGKKERHVRLDARPDIRADVGSGVPHWSLWRENAERMASEAKKALLIDQVARALEGPFIGNKLERPEWAKGRVLTKAMPVFALACFGGSFDPDDRSERRARMEAVRQRLKGLAQRLGDVSDADLKKWLYEHEKSPEVRHDEGKRLKAAARLLFQLESERPSKEKEELRKELNRLWGKTGPESRWFKLNREEFICEQFATWLIEDEPPHLADTPADKPERLPTPSKERAVPEFRRRDSPTTEEQRTEPPDDEIPPEQLEPDQQEEEEEGALPASQARIPPSFALSKKAIAIAGLAILFLMAAAALLDKVSPRPFGEILRSSNSTTVALGCGSGKTEDFAVHPTRLPDDPELVDPASLSVTVGQITFWFESLTQRDRQAGFDSWDFVFKARDSAADDLTFIFRSDISSGGGFGYVIDGPPGAGLEPRNDVCRLIDFHKTDLGEFLKDKLDYEGLEWASPHAR